MRADSGMKTHGMAHQPAYAAIAIKERVYVVEPMMRRRYPEDFAACAEVLKFIPEGKMRHESVNGDT